MKRVRRKDLSLEQIHARMAKANEIRAEKARRKTEYDTIYRKGAYFKISNGIRALLVLLAVYLWLLDSIYFYPERTQAAHCSIERVQVRGRRSSYTEVTAHMVTRGGEKLQVILSKGSKSYETFAEGDSIVVDHTLFGKPSYVSKVNGEYAYIVKSHQTARLCMLIAGIVAFISLFMTSGYDRSGRAFVLFATIVSSVCLIGYILF